MGSGFDFNLPVGIVAKINFTYLMIEKHILFHSGPSGSENPGVQVVIRWA